MKNLSLIAVGILAVSLTLTGCGTNTSPVNPNPSQSVELDSNGNPVLDAAIKAAIEQDVTATKQAIETWHLSNPGQTPNYSELIVNSNPVFTDIQVLNQGSVFTVQGYYKTGEDGKSLQLVLATEGTIT